MRRSYTEHVFGRRILEKLQPAWGFTGSDEAADWATMSVPYLSEQHLEVVTAAMAQDEAIGIAAQSVTVAINYLITDGPEGDFEYHINVGDGATSMGRGSLDEPDVSITSSYQTAAKLGRRETSSQMAFMTEKLKVKVRLVRS